MARQRAGGVRVDVAAFLFRICHSQDSVSIALRWKRSHSATLITASLSKTKGIRQNRGDGKFTRPGRASRCDNLNFLKRCPKLPVQARRHWQNSGPAEQFDGRYWPIASFRGNAGSRSLSTEADMNRQAGSAAPVAIDPRADLRWRRVSVEAFVAEANLPEVVLRKLMLAHEHAAELLQI